ncbi:flagella biosynthesis regulatory protein FliT [Mixta intestinalis]|jgi:flagellar protein FliT|uniref:Flagellar protein FliT n=1 Tax=Mixta intestinalis TaxID=1615494 RepID=A0A6P1PXZ1_9GAMM|nr:flagella biosynthesis regulatory protein FliT [Mixta intestinalis]QHM71460.1 Flagellar protein FliT [Mixta intestinalis]
MTAHLDLLRGYQQLLMLSNTLLSLAQQGQWDALIGQEVSYLQAVESVTQAVDGATLPAAVQAQIRPLLRQLLDNETQVKTLLANRMDELRALVSQGNQQKNITSAYGRLSGTLLSPGDL